MFDHLQIYHPQERLAVGLADLLLSPLSWLQRARGSAPPRRILLLRLERIGDLLMTREAIARARAAWPDASIDLAVGSWNASLARWMPVDHVDVLDVPWLAREGTGASWPALMAHARGWASRRYDLVINFEPDIRSNLLAWLTSAPRRAGYWTGGGGALLTDALAYDPATHVADNAARLLAHLTPRAVTIASPGPLRADDGARAAADAVLSGVSPSARLVGVHVAGGRESKQWHLDRFAHVARELADEDHVTVVLTGGPADRPLVDRVARALEGTPIIDAAGTLDLPGSAALLERLDVLVTGDTGPMHLAAAMGTPVVALFGPSDPQRYGPVGDGHQVLRVQLPCSPCGQVRLPPERCRGHVPDCMDGITVERVVAAARHVLRDGARR